MSHLRELVGNLQGDARRNPEDVLAVLRRVAVALCTLFAPLCEVVIHDFTDLEHSIVCLEGSISGRAVDGAATDLLLSKVKSGDTTEDLHDYLTGLPGGRAMKSSTVFLRDEDGRAYGAFCVNFDISAFLTFRRILSTLVETDERAGITEMLTDNIQTTLQSLVTETLIEMGENASIMSRDDKIELVQRLQSKGVFQVKKAVPVLADLLGLSRATLYNYLRESRSSEVNSVEGESSL